jgi:hypothetical protein
MMTHSENTGETALVMDANEKKDHRMHVDMEVAEEGEEEERLLTVGECAQLSSVEEIRRALAAVNRAQVRTSRCLSQLLPLSPESGVSSPSPSPSSSLVTQSSQPVDASRQVLLRRLDTLEILPYGFLSTSHVSRSSDV